MNHNVANVDESYPKLGQSSSIDCNVEVILYVCASVNE